MFRICKDKNGRSYAEADPTAWTIAAQVPLKERVLTAFDVDDICNDIIAGTTGEQGDPGYMQGMRFLEFVETFYAEGVGTFTWVGYCEVPAMETYSIVTGGYAPYVLSFGADKNAGVATRYEGKISSGEPFYVTYYDMFIAREAGGWSSYYSTETGMLAGNWTLERVQDDTAAAPQSLKLQTKVEKNLKAENVKYMKNFNAKALSKTVYSK